MIRTNDNEIKSNRIKKTVSESEEKGETEWQTFAYQERWCQKTETEQRIKEQKYAYQMACAVMERATKLRQWY